MGLRGEGKCRNMDIATVTQRRKKCGLNRPTDRQTDRKRKASHMSGTTTITISTIFTKHLTYNYFLSVRSYSPVSIDVKIISYLCVKEIKGLNVWTFFFFFVSLQPMVIDNDDGDNDSK